MKVAKSSLNDIRPLDARAFRFVDDVVRGMTPNDAARAQGVTLERGKRWMADERITHAITLRREEAAKAAGVDALWVLQQWVEISTADPGRLVQLRRLCCRYCYGVGHQYQWTAREYAEAAAKAMAEAKLPPVASGGVEFDFTRDPNEACPECRGEGVEDVHLTDTRFLTGAERTLLAGVKQTRNGVEVSFRDQDAALSKIADYLGMIVKRGDVNVRTPGGQPLQDVEEVFTPEELAAELAARGLPLQLLERIK